MLFEMYGAIIINKTINMMKPFMPVEQEEEPKQLKHGNWERRVVPVSDGEKSSKEG